MTTADTNQFHLTTEAPRTCIYSSSIGTIARDSWIYQKNWACNSIDKEIDADRDQFSSKYSEPPL